ncbi:glutamate receptor 2-like [Procambarus clarkii]|uniref:glutamate receptor 2-like n=1 Tax=Procambarus clarkii TaxID=6728 RepID=UPI001E67740D|nr:glutamate receptor 2-like [Procambarus clarkii]
MTSFKPLLRVAVEEWIPWTKVVEQKNGTIRLEGPMASLLEILADKINFHYELVQPSDHIWGSPQHDGSWSGLLGMLYRQEVEFAVGPFVPTIPRKNACDFSFPFYTDDGAIFMIRPSLNINDVSGFLKPFNMQVWLLTVVSLVGVVATLALLVQAEDKIYSTTTRDTLITAGLWGVKTLTQQGSLWMPKRDAGRLIATTWLLASFVFMSCYSGILTAMLTLPQVTIPIDSLADLVAQTRLPWRLEAGSMLYEYFKASDDIVRRKVFEGVSGTFQDCWASKQDIAKGKFAAICDRTTMKMAMSWDFSTSGQCHLYMSRETVLNNGVLTMAFRFNSTYHTQANKIILAVKESGLLDKWLAEQITNTSQCLRPPTSDRGGGIAPLNIEAFSGPFLMLAAGLTAGLLILLSENAVWRLNREVFSTSLRC